MLYASGSRWICGRLVLKNYMRNGCLLIGEKTAILYKIHHSSILFFAVRFGSCSVTDDTNAYIPFSKISFFKNSIFSNFLLWSYFGVYLFIGGMENTKTERMFDRKTVNYILCVLYNAVRKGV